MMQCQENQAKRNVCIHSDYTYGQRQEGATYKVLCLGVLIVFLTTEVGEYNIAKPCKARK